MRQAFEDAAPGQAQEPAVHRARRRQVARQMDD
jgi:hypothetical protein